MASPAKTGYNPGYIKTRPWPLVLLALIQIFTPFITLLFNAMALKVSPLTVGAWMLDRRPLDIFETVLLMPIAGLAVFAMRRWSYGIFLGALGWSAYRNIAHWDYASTLVPLPALLFVYLSEVAFVGYFLLPAVRTTYFDPNVRWWEHKPRYMLDLVAQALMVGKPHPARVLNVSEGGAFISLPEKLERGAEMLLSFTVITLPYSVPGKIMHVRDMGNGTWCYGVQFQHTPETADQLQNLAQALDILGYNERDGRQHWLAEFRTWLGTLLKTGRGLVPEVQKRGAPPK